MNVAIVIVTYNGMRWLPKCLESCANYKTIVVDNSSTDQTVEYISNNFKDIKILSQDHNLGFGKANNLGISLAINEGAEYVFLLNQDAYLYDNTIENLVEIAVDNPDFGILSPIHINGAETKLDKKFSNYIAYNNNNHISFDALKGNLNAVYQVPFVNAAAWLIPKKTFQTVGGFDPIFFHYGEDDNYCQRVQYHDLKIGVVTNSYAIHDREETNVYKKVALFSPKYYQNNNVKFKVKFANINKPTSNIKNDISKILKLKAKAVLKFNFKAVKGYSDLVVLIKKCYKESEESKSKNKIKNSNYLDI